MFAASRGASETTGSTARGIGFVPGLRANAHARATSPPAGQIKTAKGLNPTDVAGEIDRLVPGQVAISPRRAVGRTDRYSENAGPARASSVRAARFRQTGAP